MQRHKCKQTHLQVATSLNGWGRTAAPTRANRPRSHTRLPRQGGGLFFDINQHLIDNYKSMTLPERRSICKAVQQDKDVVAIIEKAIDKIVKNEYKPD